MLIRTRKPAYEPAFSSQEMLAIGRLIRAGDEQAARERLEKLIRDHPAHPDPRHFASSCFWKLGDRQRAKMEACIALALEPENYALSRHLALYLAEEGQRDAAIRILENGWDHCKKHLPRKLLADERALYMALSDDDLPPHLAEQRKLRRAQMQADAERYQALLDSESE